MARRESKPSDCTTQYSDLLTMASPLRFTCTDNRLKHFSLKTVICTFPNPSKKSPGHQQNLEIQLEEQGLIKGLERN